MVSRVSAAIKPSSVQESPSSSVRSELTSTTTQSSSVGSELTLTTTQITSSQSKMEVTSTESDASKFTSSPVIPTAISTEPVTVSSAVVPTSVLTSHSASATSETPNGAVSGPRESGSGFLGLLIAVFMIGL